MIPAERGQTFGFWFYARSLQVLGSADRGDQRLQEPQRGNIGFSGGRAVRPA